MRPGTCHSPLLPQVFRLSIPFKVTCRPHREALTSLQRVGGIYGLVALNSSVGVYAGGRFTSNVPMRVVQPGTHPNNSLDLKTEDNCTPAIKQEGKTRRWQRQASLPAVTTSYQAEVGA